MERRPALVGMFELGFEQGYGSISPLLLLSQSKWDNSKHKAGSMTTF